MPLPTRWDDPVSPAVPETRDRRIPRLQGHAAHPLQPSAPQKITTVPKHNTLSLSLQHTEIPVPAVPRAGTPGSQLKTAPQPVPAATSPGAEVGAREEQPGELGHSNLGTRPGWWHRCHLPALPYTPAWLLPLLLWSCASTTHCHGSASPRLGRKGDRSNLTQVPGDEGQTWGRL